MSKKLLRKKLIFIRKKKFKKFENIETKILEVIKNGHYNDWIKALLYLRFFLLMIVFKELINIDIQNKNTQKFVNINLKPLMGVTLSKGTVCNLNFPKKSLIMQIETDDSHFDIENKQEYTI